MVAMEDVRTHLLHGKLSRIRSDDDDVEVLFEPLFEANFADYFPDQQNVSSSGTFKPSLTGKEKSPLHRARILKRIRTKVANRMRSLRSHGIIEDRIEEKENLDGNLSSSRTNFSSYDDRSILEMRDDSPVHENDDSDSDVSVLSTSTNQKSQRRIISHLKTCMASSVRRIIKREAEDERKGLSPRYKDFGLYVNPSESRFYISKDRRRSAFELLLPTLETPTQSRDEVTNDADYSAGDDFRLQSQPEILVSGSALKINTTTFLPEGDHRRTATQGHLRGVQSGSDFQPPGLQTRANLFVSFDEDMAQLIFQIPSSETEMEDFRAVDVQSVESDINSISDEDSEPFIVTYPAYKVGAEFSHPGIPSKSQQLHSLPSTDTEEVPRPLGISSGHPNWCGRIRKQRDDDQNAVWSQMNDALMDGYVTDPPSPVPVTTSRDEYWCLGQADSTESDLTMTDVLLNRHGCFPSDFPPILQDMPLVQSILEKYPFDEVEGEYGVRRRPEHPYDEIDRKGSRTQILRKQEIRATMGQCIERGALVAFATARREEAERNDRVSFRERALRDKVKCGCVKCTAKSIYQDLLHCHGASVD